MSFNFMAAVTVYSDYGDQENKLCHFSIFPLFAIVVQSPSCVQLFPTPWTASCLASLSLTISQSFCPGSCPLHWWCHPAIKSSVALFSFCCQSFPASVFFSGELAIHIRWPKYWSFSFSPSNEFSELSSLKIHWFDLLAGQGTLMSLLQHHSSKSSILGHLAFFMAQFSWW